LYKFVDEQLPSRRLSFACIVQPPKGGFFVVMKDEILEEIAIYIQTQLQGNVKVKIDTKGNLIVQKGKHPEKIAFIAHMDKEGFLVIGKGKNYLEVIPTRVRELAEGDLGIVTAVDKKGTHHIGKLMHDDTFGFNAYRVSIKNPEKFEIGNPVSFSDKFAINKNIVIASNLDNAMGVVALIHICNSMSEGTAIFSAVEEIGFHGAGPAAYQVKPEKIIVIDTTYDTEMGGGARLHMGNGPSICIKDAVFGDKRIIYALRKIAENKKIPYQLEVWQTANSDMLAVHSLFSGISSCFIGLPIQRQTVFRELGSLVDIEDAITLLSAYGVSL